MSKQTMYIIVGSVLLVIVAGVGIITLNKKDDNSGNTSTPSTSNNTTDSANTADEDLGLCTIVDKATIKSALGAAADNLSGPNSTGATSLGDGDKGQTCVYPFIEGGSMTNSFYTDLAQYTQASFDSVADFTATSGTSVSGVGDRATFESGETLFGGTESTITAVKGTNVYKFVISQPKGSVTFDEASALASLTKIAQAASLK